MFYLKTRIYRLIQLLRKKNSALLPHARLIAWSMIKKSRKHYGFKDTRKNNLHKILIEHTNIFSNDSYSKKYWYSTNSET